MCPKLQRNWERPYVVIDKINDVTYRIRKGPKYKPKVVHQDRLKPYKGENPPLCGNRINKQNKIPSERDILVSDSLSSLILR